MAGRFFTDLLGSRKILSQIMGLYQDCRVSRRQLVAFIDEMNINMEEAERENPEMYRSFNDFFTRKLKPEARPLAADPEELISPADGRLLAYEKIKGDHLLQVKGKLFSLAELLKNSERASRFKNGSAVVVRLNPSDYHRFHFPADGIPEEPMAVKGRYYSVNPLSLHMTERVYNRNRREVTYIHSLEYGMIAMVEVGAALVGTIVQTYTPGMPMARGAEKGYFQFGGSTVIILVEPDKITLDRELLDNTKDGYETLVKMGETVGSIKKS